MKSGLASWCQILVFACIWITIFADSKSTRDGMVAIPQGFIHWSGKNISVEPFYIDQYETIQQAYEKIAEENPSYFKGPNRPVEKVSWFEADNYCKNKGKRLPTEWEWERAAQWGNKIGFSKKIIEDLGWFKSNSQLMTHPVGQKKQNPFGLYDMAGNVWEWTSSDHENGGKVMRGGSWRNSTSSILPSKRIMSFSHYRYHYVGFRCAASINLEL